MIIHNVEQGSPEWHALRVGKVTSSRLKEVMAKDNLSLIDKLIAEAISGQRKEGYTTAEMQRGIDLEPEARKAYENKTGHEVMQFGFLQSEQFPLLGLSPDGLIFSDGAVEFKCPDTHTHVKCIRQNQIPNDYKDQVLQYFLVHTDLEWLDFVSFDPRFAVKPLFIYRTTRQDQKLAIIEAEIRLTSFFAKLEKYQAEVIF